MSPTRTRGEVDAGITTTGSSTDLDGWDSTGTYTDLTALRDSAPAQVKALRRERRSRRVRRTLRRVARSGLTRAVPLLMLCVWLLVNLRYPHVSEHVRLQVFDTYQKLQPRQYQDVPVRIVDIDEVSLSRIGQWPWPRTYMAEIIDRLGAVGAQVITLDIILSEPDRTSPENIVPLWQRAGALPRVPDAVGQLPAHDHVLADAMARARVVTGHVLTRDAHQRAPPRPYVVVHDTTFEPSALPSFSSALLNLPSLDAAAVANGSFNLVPDRDGVVRRLHLLFERDGQLYASLAAETLRAVQRNSLYDIRPDPAMGAQLDARGIERLRIGDLAAPTDARGRMWLHYTPSEPARYVSAHKILEADSLPMDLAGHIVLIGSSASGLRDLRATPLNPVTPGVEIHASVIEQVLLGAFLYRPSWLPAAEFTYLVALAVLLVAVLPLLGALKSALVGGAFATGAVMLSWYAFAEHGWLVDPVLPSLTVLMVFACGSLINYALTERERRRVKDAFARYLAPSVIGELLEEPSRLSLRGERRDTTFVFTDVAGFTALTENIEPPLLVRLLNEYLDGACRIVFEHDGTIDKIVGDALHVMFNAPIDQADHADRAVRCALALDEFCCAFQARWKAQGIDFGVTRIGVNTGPTVVGNFGGRLRFDYTAHGDAINTAARLESVNKHLGTRICVSDVTRGASSHPHYRPVGSIVLKGKTERIAVFEPVTAEFAGSEHMRQYLAAFALVQAEDEGALDAFIALRKQYSSDGLVQFYLEKLLKGDVSSTTVMSDK